MKYKSAYLITSLLVITLFIFNSCNKNVVSKKEQQAEELFKAKNYEEARKIYLELMNNKPKNLKQIQEKIAKIDSIVLYNKKESKYLTEIAIADEHFENERYEEAKLAYQNATDLFPERNYPLDQLFLIDEHEQESVGLSNSYYIIVGSFKQRQNAENFKLSLESKAYDSKIIDRPHNFHAVSMSHYNSLTEAWNELRNAKIINENAWVLYYTAN